MQVIWDGRRSGPGGAMLFADEGSITPPPVNTYGTIMQRVRAIVPTLGDREFSTEECQQAAQFTRGQAASVISYLCRIGKLERCRKRAMSQRQVYRVTK